MLAPKTSIAITQPETLSSSTVSCGLTTTWMVSVTQVTVSPTNSVRFGRPVDATVYSAVIDAGIGARCM